MEVPQLLAQALAPVIPPVIVPMVQVNVVPGSVLAVKAIPVAVPLQIVAVAAVVTTGTGLTNILAVADGRQLTSVGVGERIAYIKLLPTGKILVVVVAPVPPPVRLPLGIVANTVPPVYGVAVAALKYLNVMP